MTVEDRLIPFFKENLSLMNYSGFNFISNDTFCYSEKSGQEISDNGNLYFSRNIHSNHIPDWYFIIVIGILIIFTSIKVIYNRILKIYIETAYNFQIAEKIFRERSIIYRRVGLILDLIYFVNGALFILLIVKHYNWNFLGDKEFLIFIRAVGLLSGLMLLRITIMKIIGFIFDRSQLFSGFLYHFYIYTKILGLLFIPFLIAIPYTTGTIKEVLITASIIFTVSLYLIRFTRAIIYTINNVVLIFYLILYLCTLEILSVFVIIRLMRYLMQV